MALIDKVNLLLELTLTKYPDTRWKIWGRRFNLNIDQTAKSLFNLLENVDQTTITSEWNRVFEIVCAWQQSYQRDASPEFKAQALIDCERLVEEALSVEHTPLEHYKL